MHVMMQSESTYPTHLWLCPQLVEAELPLENLMAEFPVTWFPGAPPYTHTHQNSAPSTNAHIAMH